MKKTVIPFLMFALFMQTSCHKEKRYIYQVQQQELYENSSQKHTLKSTTQFISIAYSDLFGSSITNEELNKFDVALQSFGDKGILQDMIVKSLLHRSGIQAPDNTAMRADLPAFVENTYLRFLNRKPNEFEEWKMKDMIEKNVDITPTMVYYSIMTSEEYKYY